MPVSAVWCGEAASEDATMVVFSMLSVFHVLPFLLLLPKIIIFIHHKLVAKLTPCPEKRGQSILAITLTDLDTVSYFLAWTTLKTHFTKKIENVFLTLPLSPLRNRDVIGNDVITYRLRKRYNNILSNNFGKLKRIVVIFAKQQQRSKEKLTVQRKSTPAN